MSKQIYPSTVVHFREQQAQQEEAAFLGLHGLAVDDVIEAQMHRQAQHLVLMQANSQHEEVEREMNRQDWGFGERDGKDGTS